MRLIRTIQRRRLLLWFLFLSLGLRSLIAPGFMLDTGGAGPFGLSVSICPGPNGIYAIPAFANPHDGHHTAGSQAPASDHDHSVSGMSGATCGTLSAGSISLVAVVYTGDRLLETGPERFSVPPAFLLPQPAPASPQQARAPPVSPA